MILSSPALDRRNAAIRAIADRIARIGPEWGVAAQQPPGGLSRDAAAVRRFAADPRIYRGRLPAVMAASTLRVAHRVHGAARSWAVPALIVHGTADRFTPAAASVAMIDRIVGCDKVLDLVPGGRHELLNDSGAEQVLATLLAWIEARLPPIARKG